MPETACKAVLIHWFRRDLRVHDNPALARLLDDYRRLCEQGRVEIGVSFIYLPQAGAIDASHIRLDHSLRALNQQLLEFFGLPLDICLGDWSQALDHALSREFGQPHIIEGNLYDCRLHEPKDLTQERRVNGICRQRACMRHQEMGNYLLPPEQYQRESGGPYRVFTAFAKNFMPKLRPVRIEPVKPEALGARRLRLEGFEAFEGLPGAEGEGWKAKLAPLCEAGEKAAGVRWQEFCNQRLKSYAEGRHYFTSATTSLMSASLHFGEICVHRLHRDLAALAADGLRDPSGELLRSLMWREYANAWLVYYPKMTKEPMLPEFGSFPWRRASKDLEAWKRGRTGYPVVDAAMRELRETGWMHNRLRMLVASFLVKHLLIHWRHGMQWFAEALLDFDLANNTMSWQWSAGTGFDSVPYFRIFSPLRQSAKFDPDGDYLRQWLPELAGLESPAIHDPTPQQRQSLGYPEPIVDHRQARQRALNAWRGLRAAARAKG